MSAHAGDGRSGPCSSGKRRYADRLAALIVLADTQRYGSGSRAERRVYRCPLCRGWHLTSRADYTQPRLGEVRPAHDILRGRGRYDDAGRTAPEPVSDPMATTGDDKDEPASREP